MNSLFLLNKTKINNFSHFRVFSGEYKIVFTYKSNLILVGVYSAETPTFFSKLLQMHLYVALINYKENTLDKLSYLNSPSRYNTSSNFHNINSNSNSNLNTNNSNNFYIDSIVNFGHKNEYENTLTTNTNANTNTGSHGDFINYLFKGEFLFADYVELKIFERYFVKYLINHFSKVLQIISGKEDMYLSGIKLKNVYYVDIQSQTIIYSSNKINSTNSKEKPKFYKNEVLWEYILSLIQYLETDYCTETRQRESFCGNNFEFYRNNQNCPFIKFEMTSTYPRYSFFIKYLPVLGGLGIIHEYTQKKLSRMVNVDKNTLLSQDHFLKKKYYEFKTIYNLTMNKCENNNFSIHSDLHSNKSNIIKYLEPEMLLNTEKFFIEFFLATKKQEDIFYYPKENIQPKYFSQEILNTIHSILSSKETSLQGIMNQIEQKLIQLEPLKSQGSFNLHIITEQAKKKERTKLDNIFSINYTCLISDLNKSKGNCMSFYSTNNNNHINHFFNKKQKTFYQKKKSQNELRHIHSFTPFGKKGLYDTFKMKKKLGTSSECECLIMKNGSNITRKKDMESLVLNDDGTSLSVSKWDDFSKEENVTLNLSRKFSEINYNGARDNELLSVGEVEGI